MSANTKKLRIKQVRSTIGRKADQGATMRALGLRRINSVVEQDDTPVIRGMIFKVKHLIEVEEI
jgi:large subunit ribosomal protein L30